METCSTCKAWACAREKDTWWCLSCLFSSWKRTYPYLVRMEHHLDKKGRESRVRAGTISKTLQDLGN